MKNSPDEITLLIRSLLKKTGGNVAEAKSLFTRRLRVEASKTCDERPSFEEVSARLSYDPATGILRWKRGRPDRIGEVAGSGKKYRYVRLGARSYLAHHIAWLLMTGAWPNHIVDHRNGKTQDNSWGNLRAATSSQNGANRLANSGKKSGLPIGVFRKRDKFRSAIKVGGIHKNIGTFNTAEEATAARTAAAVAEFGDFVRA